MLNQNSDSTEKKSPISQTLPPPKQTLHSHRRPSFPSPRAQNHPTQPLTHFESRDQADIDGGDGIAIDSTPSHSPSSKAQSNESGRPTQPPSKSKRSRVASESTSPPNINSTASSPSLVDPPSSSTNVGASRDTQRKHSSSEKNEPAAPQDNEAQAPAPVKSGEINVKQYSLKIVQEPSLGSAFGSNLLSRIALAPPLILELQVFDSDGNQVDASADAPFLVCHCTLVTQNERLADMLNSTETVTNSPSAGQDTPDPSVTSTAVQAATALGQGGQRGMGQGRSRPSASRKASSSSLGETRTISLSNFEMAQQPLRMLYGTLVSNPLPYPSPEGKERMYLFYPEISVRATGRFKLSCVLMNVPVPGTPTELMGGSSLASVTTNAFEVVSPSEYTAPYITDITRHFARQGAGLLLPPGQSTD